MRFLTFMLTCIGLFGCTPDAPAPAIDEQSREPFSVILAGGAVYTGNDAESRVMDVGIRDDLIIEIGDLRARQAVLRLDVTGLAVAPGFIDIHSHAVRQDPEDGIFRWPDAENLIRQGVTTVVGGPDGSSPLPIAETLHALEENPASVNFATMVGHGSVRALIIGEQDRPPADEELHPWG